MTEKFSASGAYRQDVPFAVYSNFNFMKAELESGWFAVKIERDGRDFYGKKSLTKVGESDVFILFAAYLRYTGFLT